MPTDNNGPNGGGAGTNGGGKRKGPRVVNHSRRYSVTVHTANGAFLVLPGFMYVGGDVETISCESPDEFGRNACINDKDEAFSLDHAQSDALLHDRRAGGLEMQCIGATAVARPEVRAEEIAANQEKIGDPVWVTVIGAGIAGLTAAHELAERGVFVQVIEKAHSTPSERTLERSSNDAKIAERLSRGLRQPDVGGVARTQWVVPTMESRSHPDPLRWRPRATQSVHGDIVWDPRTARQPQPNTNVERAGVARAVTEERNCFYVPFLNEAPYKFEDYFKRWWERLNENGPRPIAALQLVAVVYRTGSVATHSGDVARIVGAEAAYARLNVLRSKIQARVLEAANSQREAIRCFLDIKVLPAARVEITLSDEAIEQQQIGWQKTFTGACIRAFEDIELVAGEHGFRFFPGFYRHLRDTMTRTPLIESRSGDATEHSVHDHLHEVEWQTIADPTRVRPSSFARRNIGSLSGLVEQYQTLRRELGYRPSDLLRFTLRMLRYATSSSARRAATYEDLSWYDFLTLRDLRGAKTPLPITDSGDNRERLHYGRRFESTIRHSPRALVAMDSTTTDARSQGNISLQLGMDQFDLHEATDSTLRAPTSDAWLVHWKDYLQRIGVRFYTGEVSKIDLVDGNSVLKIDFATGERPIDFVEESDLNKLGAPHYVISAMDLVGAQRACSDLAGRFGPEGGRVAVPDCLKALISDVGPAVPPAVPPAQAQPDRDPEDIRLIAQHRGDRLQTLTGIQIYFQQRTSFVDGHIYYAESPWGLSAVSQVQYWRPFMGERSLTGLLGNLSIDIGAWRSWKPSREEKQWLPDRAEPEKFWQDGVGNPNDLTPEEIAAGVCDQVTSCSRMNQNDWASPAFFHIDDCIEFAWTEQAKGSNNWVKRPSRNRYPYLVNVVGDWSNRPPGDPWSPNDPGYRELKPGQGRYLVKRSAGDDSISVWSRLVRDVPFGYRVHGRRLVFCGAWLRTYTRMGTMESANESARHAVNAILDHLAYERGLGAAAPAAELSNPPPGGNAQGDAPIAQPDDLSILKMSSEHSFLHPRSGAVINPGQPTVRRGTPFGDYCDIWDPERFEFPDLAFAKLIDEKVMEQFARTNRQRRRGDGDDVYVPPPAPAGAPPKKDNCCKDGQDDYDYSGLRDGVPVPPPHLFDRLGVDRIPDLIEHDGEAVSALTLIDGLNAALREAGGADAEATVRSIEAWGVKLDRFVSDLHRKHIVK